MFIGQTVLAKINNQLKECRVIEMYENEVKLLCEGETIIRKYWEVKKLTYEKKSENS